MKLFLDDLRNPPDESWVLARSVVEALSLVEEHGMPSMMSLDHDLGGDETVMQFLRILSSERFDEGPCPYVVHSANPVGRDNIISLMESWKKARHLP